MAMVFFYTILFNISFCQSEPITPQPVNVTLMYQDAMIIFWNEKDGVALKFTKELRGKNLRGVSYRFRWLNRKTGKVVSGPGELIEWYKWVPTKDPLVEKAVDLGSITEINRGSLSIPWYFWQQGGGLFLYYPEECRMITGRIEDFEKISLKRLWAK